MRSEIIHLAICHTPCKTQTNEKHIWNLFNGIQLDQTAEWHIFCIFPRFKTKPSSMIRRFTFSICILLASILWANAQISFGPNSPFNYLKGKDASTLPANWMTNSYNPTGWVVGNAPFWYGDGAGGTQLTDMLNSYSTLYLRSTFTAQNIKDLQNVSFSVNFDDGFIIWINGEEAIRVNAPTDHPYNSFSTDLHESGTFETYTLPARDLELYEGENLIALQGFNTTLESSDFHINVQVRAAYSPPPSTDTLKVVFSQPNGFYTDPFELKLDVPDPAYSILYTIDGSNPQSSPTVRNGGKSKTITINPTSITGRDKTPCYMVRASLKKDGEPATFPLTQTYIFLDEVIKQTAPGGNWPAPINVRGQQVIDLEMDTKVTGDPKYSGQMKDAFQDIPSISVVTDLPNLFDPATGIYVNALEHGEDWERFSSVELIDPSGKPGFNINAGLRIRGGYSRHDSYPKHAFRLFFREEYGASKLNYPLFEDEGVDEFDKIDLRCEQNYAWSNDGNCARNTAVREVVVRDIQGKMGQPYTRSRYYHLYLNGMYWGLYQTQERSEARYAASYLGGSPEDYDVIKVNGDYSYTIEATDGTTASFQKIYELCNTGFTTNAAYFNLEGKDQNGKPKKGAEVLVDIDNLIDYMQLTFYTGNFDAPISSFLGNSSPNNFYAIDRRDDKSSGFIFMAHDGEHTMMIESEEPGIGLYENRVPISGNVSDFSKFQPQWLHYKLAVNKEYQQRFADRAYKNFYNKGVFVPANVQGRFQNRAAEINKAIISESARWGDFTTGNNQPYTWDNWDREIKDIYARFIPQRTQIVIDQMKAAKLMVDVKPPTYTKDNVLLVDETYSITGSYKVTVASATGQIFYTLDGSDPRKIGGLLNTVAKEIKSGSSLDLKGTAIINARVRIGSEWSALATVKFINANEDYTNLKVTELHYNPTDTIVVANPPALNDTVSGKSFEFIELKNTGDQPISLSGLSFTSGIDYQFKSDDVLAPNQFYVIASKPKWFYERHWMVPTGNFEKNFSNTGEQVLVSNAVGAPVIDFQFYNTAPWATAPDGTGKSLTSGKINPTGNPNDFSYWSASSVYDGTPFADDLGVIDTIIDPADHYNLVTIYPNPTQAMLNLKVKDSNAEVQVEIYTLTGTRVYNSILTGSNVIDLRQLHINSGIYLVNTKYEQKNEVYKVVYQP